MSTEADIVEMLQDAIVIHEHYGKCLRMSLSSDDIEGAIAEITKLRAERDAAAREEAWIVTQSGLAVSMWLTELAATKVLDSYKRSTKGKGNWAVERVTVIRALPSTVIATDRKAAT